MDIKTEKITSLLKEQIEKFDSSVDVSEVGEVIEIGDGVARVTGLENVMSSELIELPGIGHCPQLQDPEAFLNAVLPFLQP